jgi:hypothetical protein
VLLNKHRERIVNVARSSWIEMREIKGFNQRKLISVNGKLNGMGLLGNERGYDTNNSSTMTGLWVPR